MKIRFNPLVLGIFVVGGAAIAIAALLGLGSNYFHPAGHFIFYLPRSAEGLNEGDGVRLNGVRVGQVDHIGVFYDTQSQESFVGMICEIDKKILTDTHGRPINITDEHTLRELVSKGLYAQVQTAGLVGEKYVELGFNSTTPPMAQAGLPTSGYPTIPTVPSTMSSLTGNVSGILSNLRRIDFQGLVQQINGLLVSTRGQMNELETNRLTDNLSTAAQSVDQFMNSSDLRGAVTRLQEATLSFQNLVTNLNAQVRPAGTNLNATLESARESVEALRDFLNLRNQLGEQTRELLEQLNQTALSIQQLSDFLDRHPNALITGRARRDNAP